jgi:hypothetical protein
MIPFVKGRSLMNEIEKRSAELLQLLGMCAKLAPTFDTMKPGAGPKRVLDALRSSIEDLWVWFAEGVATDFPGATVDSGHPGYIIMDKVLVPFFLLQDLPGTAELAELVTLGLSVRLTKDGVICLSGSTALLGTLKFVGDIDYCEYALPGTFTTSDILASASAHAARTALPLCERIKVMKPKWTKNCTDWDSAAPAELQRHIDKDGARQLKLDFMTNTATVGSAEATNMALLLDAGKEDEIVRASFAAQEVPIPGSVLPRPLCEPLQLGRYINFLITEIQHYAEENPVKALKRAFSLERILILPVWDNKIKALLQDPRAALTAAINARSQLLQVLSSPAEAGSPRAQVRESLRASLESTIAILEKTLKASPVMQLSTQAATNPWEVEASAALASFLRDARRAIADAGST